MNIIQNLQRKNSKKTVQDWICKFFQKSTTFFIKLLNCVHELNVLVRTINLLILPFAKLLEKTQNTSLQSIKYPSFIILV